MGLWGIYYVQRQGGAAACFVDVMRFLLLLFPLFCLHDISNVHRSSSMCVLRLHENHATLSLRLYSSLFAYYTYEITVQQPLGESHPFQA